ncbi:hypothetical protein RhiXN_05449 [Rhizoctonia solani]|uniref:Uncharacterized protein n=1 Tax=Rhizoctonia solani TaxID=456999 RepID=A0A8H8NSJ5_9AGAM|nr:uncharacterized protein RhiXN_05449 [Rhizoctonia solani]QRW17447.1 hypothetical protein RhiXN_05449 [Rhizoctonia solani]
MRSRKLRERWEAEETLLECPTYDSYSVSIPKPSKRADVDGQCRGLFAATSWVTTFSDDRVEIFWVFLQAESELVDMPNQTRAEKLAETGEKLAALVGSSYTGHQCGAVSTLSPGQRVDLYSLQSTPGNPVRNKAWD